MDNTLNCIERISALLRTEMRKLATAHDLQLVHAEILDYLSRCNKYSNTPLALSEFLGQTKGTVSQSLKVLVRKKLISRKKDAKDGRVIRLSLTKAGQDVINDIQSRLSLIPKPENGKALERVNQILVTALQHMQTGRQHKSFGLCASCRYNIKKDEGHFQCGLTGEALTAKDTTKICREHDYA